MFQCFTGTGECRFGDPGNKGKLIYVHTFTNITNCILSFHFFIISLIMVTLMAYLCRIRWKNKNLAFRYQKLYMGVVLITNWTLFPPQLMPTIAKQIQIRSKRRTSWKRVLRHAITAWFAEVSYSCWVFCYLSDRWFIVPSFIHQLVLLCCCCCCCCPNGSGSHTQSTLLRQCFVFAHVRTYFLNWFGIFM